VVHSWSSGINGSQHATIGRRTASDGTVSYRVRVRVLGEPLRTRTFKRKTDAIARAAAIESSAGVQWPVMQPRVRQMTVDFSPLTQKVALSSDRADLQTIFGTIAASPVVAVLPFTQCDPAFYSTDVTENQKLVAKTAFLGAFLNPPQITGNGDMYYDATMTVQESI
jgi:hypothetical protein